MSGSPPHSPGDQSRRLQHCIRDLAALNALPSMCIGRSPDEALDVVLDALPTALTCELVYLTVPGAPPRERASLRGVAVREAELPSLRAAMSARTDDGEPTSIPNAGTFWCVEVELPVGAGRGRLVVGLSAPPDPETDRILIRSAANLVGTTLETANVLEAARRKDEFLAMLGHELRNPLAPILTATELLARNPSAARECSVIERNTRHLTRLVDDLLDISRVTRGHVELRDEQVSLSSVLERAIELATPLITRNRHTLRFAWVDGITLKGDPVRLAQVFGNLLSNAAKFTPPRGSIELSIDRHGDRVRVSVRDNGRGVARDQLGLIFEPFVQLDRKRDALGGGLGLGLAIVSNLVARHGGTITAHSEGLGRGATFTVNLPTVTSVAEPVAPSARATQARVTNARGSVRVLVVDDNADLAELLSEALQQEGFQTAIAHDAHVAIETWRSFGPHAAVLDLGLPMVDGYELAKSLRAEHGTEPTLIAATGYGQPRDRQRTAEAGFDCHFVKPVSVQDLVTVLDAKVVTRAASTAPQ